MLSRYLATAALALALLTACAHPVVDGHPVRPAKLSHVAVESFIARNLQVADVVCNGGENFPLVKVGDTFKCTASGGKSFTVTIKDTTVGRYVVS